MRKNFKGKTKSFQKKEQKKNFTMNFEKRNRIVKQIKFYEIFESITAFQFVVEKIQLINSDLIVGFSKSKQLLRIWSIKRREAIFQFHLSTSPQCQILMIDTNINQNLFFLSNDYLLQNNIQSLQNPSQVFKEVNLGIIKHEIQELDCNNNQISKTINQITLSKEENSIIKLFNINEKSFKMVDPQNNKLGQKKLKINQIQNKIDDFYITSKSERLFIINQDGIIFCYDLKSVRKIQQWRAFIQKSSYILVANEEASTLISTAKNLKIKIWDMKKYFLLRKIDIRVMSLTKFDCGNQKLLLGSFKPSIDVYDFKTHYLIQNLDLDYPLLQIEIESSNSVIAALDYDFQIVLLRKKTN